MKDEILNQLREHPAAILNKKEWLYQALADALKKKGLGYSVIAVLNPDEIMAEGKKIKIASLLSEKAPAKQTKAETSDDAPKPKRQYRRRAKTKAQKKAEQNDNDNKPAD